MTEKKAETGKKAGSKFSGLLAAVHERAGHERQENGEAQEEAALEEAPSEPYEKPAEIRPSANDVPSVKRGRPRGKRSSDDFVQVTAYIGRDTHRAVKMALLGVGESREFSELVEELLAGWLQSGR